MKTIEASFSDVFPFNGIEHQRDGARRRLFAMCMTKAENEGLPDRFTCERTITEVALDQTLSRMVGSYRDAVAPIAKIESATVHPAFVRITVSAKIYVV